MVGGVKDGARGRPQELARRSRSALGLVENLCAVGGGGGGCEYQVEEEENEAERQKGFWEFHHLERTWKALLSNKYFKTCENYILICRHRTSTGAGCQLLAGSK